MKDILSINKIVGNHLKGKIVSKGIAYKQLAERLANVGIKCTESSLATRLSRGTFSATFYFQCLAEIGCESDDIKELLNEMK